MKKPNLVFPVISDVHIKSDDPKAVEKFKAIFRQINHLYPNQDAFVVVGDLTEEGGETEFDFFMETLKSNILPNPELLITIGNHDYWNDLSVDEAQKRFLEKTGMESIYYKKKINGYHFIMLGTEDGCTEGTFSLEQIEWLDQQLKAAQDEDGEKPIFIFHHQPLTETVYGSSWGIIRNRDEFYNVLKKYPQVISFSGHTHYSIEHPRIIHQKDFTSIGTSTSGYLFLDDHRIQGEIPEGANDFAQAWVVEVYNEKVVLNRRDIYGDREIIEPLEIMCPINKENFCYTDDRDAEPPYFEENATIKVEQSGASNDALVLSFSQAKDNLFVQDYKIVVRDCQNKATVKELLSYSDFYKNPVPEQMTIEIAGLTPDTEYEIEVWAIDAFENMSESALKVLGRSSRI